MAPFTRILAAVDFTEASAKALAYAARVSHFLGAELDIVHVIHPSLVAAAGKDVDLVPETQTSLESFAAAVPCVPANVHCQVVTGLPSDAIMHAADRNGVDLIVAGSRGVALPERVAFGATTERLLRVAGTSVLVVPDSIAPNVVAASQMRVASIVVGLECTGGAADAARAAKQMAATLGADLRFVHAVAEIKTAPRWSAFAALAIRRRCDSSRDELNALLGGLAIDLARLDVRVGAVPRVLAEAIAGKPDALVVLGRCYGAPGHAGCAAMARRMLTLASVPVLMYVTPA